MDQIRYPHQFPPVRCFQAGYEPVLLGRVRRATVPLRQARRSSEKIVADERFEDVPGGSFVQIQPFRHFFDCPSLGPASPHQQERLEARHALDSVKDESIEFSRVLVLFGHYWKAQPTVNGGHLAP